MDAQCPACDGRRFLALEAISLAEQHRDYSSSEETQRQLTSRVPIPGGRYQMLRCSECGLEFADPFKAPESSWYDLVYGVLSLYPSKRWEFERALEMVKPGDKLGELGCGSGEFLKQCKKNGVEAAGVDFSSDAVQACTKAGLQVQILNVTGQLPEFMLRADRDFVVAFQVLEHLDDPGSLFKLAAAWIKTNGSLLVAVPSDRRPSRCYNERDFLDQPPHHMSRWTGRSLEAIGQKHGWRLRKVTYAPLGFMARVWYASTRTQLYKSLERNGRQASVILKIATRLALLPYAAIWALFFCHRLSGHPMLAEYERNPQATQ